MAKKQWDELTPNEKAIGLIGVAVVVALATFLITAIVGAVTKPQEPKKEETVKVETKEEPKPVAKPETKPEVKLVDYKGQEGLIVFKELEGKGYQVKANYVNEIVPAASQDFTEQFKASDPNKCEDRLGYDAYIVDNLTQDGANVNLILANEPKITEACTTE